VLQCVTVGCSVLQCVERVALCVGLLQCFTCVALCCSDARRMQSHMYVYLYYAFSVLLHFVAVCCTLLQCVAVCCIVVSVLQCAAVYATV